MLKPKGMKINKLLLLLAGVGGFIYACEDSSVKDDFNYQDTVEFEREKMTFQEDADTVQIPVIISGFAKNDVEVTVEVRRKEELTAREDTNFILLEKTVRIPKDGSAASIPMKIINDNVVNPDRSFDLIIKSVVGAEKARISQVCRVVIANEDFWPLVTMSKSKYQTTEHDDQLVIPLTATGIFYQPTQVTVLVNSGTAVEGTNFTIDRKEFTFDNEHKTDSIVVKLASLELQEDCSFDLELEITDGLPGKVKASKVVIKDVQKFVGFPSEKIKMLKNAKEVKVPVLISGVRSPRDLVTTIGVKSAGSLVEGSDFTLTDNVITTKGDTTLYATLRFTTDKVLQGDLIELEVKDVQGGEIDEITPSATMEAVEGDEFNRSNWKILSFTSEEPTGESGGNNGKAIHLIDGSTREDRGLGTFWHSRWASAPTGVLPYEFVIDMQQQVNVGFVRLYRRQPTNSAVKLATIELSTDNVNWSPVYDIDFTTTDPENSKILILPDAQKARYIRLGVPARGGNGNTASLAELMLFGLPAELK